MQTTGHKRFTSKIEEWRFVKGFNNYYQVSTRGRIRSLRRNSILKPNKTKQGYLLIKFSIDKAEKTLSIHRLVAKAFIPNSNKERNTVNHINGIKDDNRVENLEWLTQGENNKHAFSSGLRKPNYPMRGKFGKLNPRSKPVIQYNKNGEFICEYESVEDASRVNNIHPELIGRIARGNSGRKHAGGFKWKYKLIE